MYAKVIVDVSAWMTNRPFDYAVPDSLAPLVEIGSRVGVPFGSRVVQGFVVDLCREPETEPDKVKAVEQVLDLFPPLTPELVGLARWMSEKYMCREIASLSVMLPAALKARYEKYIAVSEVAEDRHAGQLEDVREVCDYIRAREQVSLESLLQRFPSSGGLVRQLIREGVLAEEQRIKDRLSKKKQLTVYPAGNSERLREWAELLPERAAKQKRVLQRLSEQPEPVALRELCEELQVTASVVKSLADKEYVSIREMEVFRDPYAGRQFAPSPQPELTEDQAQALRPIKEALEQSRHQAFLLHGVTGSGKTEVYLQAIQHGLELGRDAIVLVPEISLTPQMVERFKGRFGDRVAVLHSRLSHGERYDEWRKIQAGRVQVAIGARSAVFAPFQNIGLIIMDEEHETSYKQEDSPKYHAREVALQRARTHKAAVVLGSATPCMESYHLSAAREAAAGSPAPAYQRLEMPARVQGRPLPGVQIVDMREELKQGNRSMFSRALHQGIADRLERQEQTVLLLNRRGHSTFVMCRSCGYVASCPHCEISLTYHLHSRTLRCHYCGYAQREEQTCPDCGSSHIRYFGTGTQKVEEELVKLFPGIRVIRMDVDTTSEKGSHEKWLNLFRSRQGDVLLGTQMVAKGLDFPHVTLVGVIAADTVLHLPDFRAAEKTFQLLTQVAGRAGRHELPGEVVIQTYCPEHASIQHASRHDYTSFAEEELAQRRSRLYPPFCRLILVTFSHEQVQLLVRTGEAFAARVRELQAEHALKQREGMEEAVDIMGPVASPIPRIKDRYRFQCLVKYRESPNAALWVRQAVDELQDAARKDNVLIAVDVDPQLLM